MESEFVPLFVCGNCGTKLSEISCSGCNRPFDPKEKIECVEGKHYHSGHKNEKWFEYAGKAALLDYNLVWAVIGPEELVCENNNEDFPIKRPNESLSIFNASTAEGDYYEQLVDFDWLRTLLKQMKAHAGTSIGSIVIKVPKYNLPVQFIAYAFDSRLEVTRGAIAPRREDWFKKEKEPRREENKGKEASQ